MLRSMWQWTLGQLLVSRSTSRKSLKRQHSSGAPPKPISLGWGSYCAGPEASTEIGPGAGTGVPTGVKAPVVASMANTEMLSEPRLPT